MASKDEGNLGGEEGRSYHKPLYLGYTLEIWERQALAPVFSPVMQNSNTGRRSHDPEAGKQSPSRVRGYSV
jgi:hypothetical protein